MYTSNIYHKRCMLYQQRPVFVDIVYMFYKKRPAFVDSDCKFYQNKDLCLLTLTGCARAYTPHNTRIFFFFFLKTHQQKTAKKKME